MNIATKPSAEMQAVYDWIDAHADECIADLQAFVQRPSISAQNIGLRETAEWLRDLMHRDGLPAEFHELDARPPSGLRPPASEDPRQDDPLLRPL
jgi:acetylornithine deacetylase/succinyl-diaminopimelate desuccinylase-like protein